MDEEDSDEDVGLLGTGVEEDDRNWFEEKIMNPHLQKVADEVRAAIDLLGASKITAKGNALVIVTAPVDDVLTYANSFFKRCFFGSFFNWLFNV